MSVHSHSDRDAAFANLRENAAPPLPSVLDRDGHPAPHGNAPAACYPLTALCSHCQAGVHRSTPDSAWSHNATL